MPLGVRPGVRMTACLPSDFAPVTDAMLGNPAPGDWLSKRPHAQRLGCSPLDQIDRKNVGGCARPGRAP